MNQINDMPDETIAGLTFNYAVWTAGTTLQLCNVPWNSDYRDIVEFDNQDAINTYLDSRVGQTIQFSQATLAKPGQPVRISLPYSSCYAYNYLRVTNAAMPMSNAPARTFYYFITDVKYIAPNTTELVIQLDVWQSFGRDVLFGNCYLERGHLPMALTDQFDDFGKKYLTMPEGLDVGSEYNINAHYGYEMANSTDINSLDIIVVSTTELAPPYGDVASPVLKSATGSGFEGLPNGASIYWFPHDTLSFMLLMSNLQDRPWVSQGIISVTAIPALNLPRTGPNVTEYFAGAGSNPFYKLWMGKVPNERVEVANAAWRDYAAKQLGTRYAGLKKFLTYPYCVVELTSYTGTPLMLKPECINTDKIYAQKYMHLAPPNPRILFSPYRYNAGANMPADENFNGIGYDQGEFLDMTTGFYDLPQFSVVNNGYMSYMASNRNGIAYQHTSADWSQNRAIQGANTAASQASGSIGAGNSMVGSQMRQNADQAYQSVTTSAMRGGLGMVTGAGGGAASGLSGGGAGAVAGSVTGMLSSGVNAAIDANQATQSAAINNRGINQRWGAEAGQQAFVRDTNLEYATFAANGDYANAIAGINAKVQDAKMIQPTTSGQLGGDAFLLSVYKWGCFANVKLPQPAIIAQIGELWLRYGYSFNRFVQMSGLGLRLMTRFTYWKMKETYIISTGVPELYRQTIRGIFEKGVTVWTNPQDIGIVDTADNHPLDGITL